MPEGDTIRHVARALDAALRGHTVTHFASTVRAVAAMAERLRLVGRTLEGVEARGKHLLICFAGGPVLHTHLGMHGGWRIESPSGSARRWPAQVVVQTADAVATCLRAAVVELLPRGVASHPALTRLGPDLLDESFDAVAARARLHARGELEIGVALLDQTALAGIGNVYKSEVLYLCGVSPRTRVRDLDDTALDALVATARRLMQRNLGPGPRRTTSPLSPERLFVYRRSGQPCRKCGTPIRRIVQGEQARSTYFCPSCQA